MQALQNSQIHIYQVDLDKAVDCWHCLTPEEQQRADEIRIQTVKDRFINSRGLLRQYLSHYLQQAPHNILLNSQEKGKLYIKDSPLLFNLAHSNNMALYAFNYDYEIGIDIEQQRSLTDLLQIAERVFSTTELDYLTTVTQAKRLDAFFKLWTRKEAVIKTSGEGLAADLRSITTTQHTGSIVSPLTYLQPFQCQLQDIEAPKGYAAALAAYTQEREIKIFK